MTLMSTEDSEEEEHSSIFYQLLLDLLSYSSASYSAFARYPILGNKEVMLSLGNFISEQLNLTKDSVSEIKIHTLVPELLKGVQVALDAVTRLCRVYSDGVNWDIYLLKTKEVESITDIKEAENADPVINMIKCTIEKLCELGVLAADNGGSLVSLLNMSWKGVVTLLQLGNGALAAKVNIAGVIMTLISLANESLRCAAGTWSASLKEMVSVSEAKRIYLPVKFYLINAVRIISQYQCEALSLYRDITHCVIMILTFRISLSKVEPLKSASEVLAEILEPTSLHLLNGLLTSGQVKEEQKFHILDWLFSNDSDLGSVDEITNNNDGNNSLHAIFSVNSNAMNQAKVLDLGRVALFLHLLKSAPDLEDDVRFGIARKLGWLLDILINEEVYSSIIALQTPAVNSSGQNQELGYQPMFCSVLHALKTFMIVTSSSPVWGEVESFLLENLFHPHFLCWEIITELWCFMLRHADPDMMNDIVDKLFSLLRHTAAPESVLFPSSHLRKIARLICMFLNYGTELMVDRVYTSVVGNDRSQCSSSVYTALIMEGFPLNSLPEKTRSTAKERIITEYFHFIESMEEKSSEPCVSGIYGAPVFVLSAALQSLQVSLSDTEMKTLKYLVPMIHKYKNSTDDQIKDHYCKLLGELLGIFSHMNHLYSSDDMEGVILELQKLFISRPEKSDGQLFWCKPNLARFMGGLGHMDLADSDDSARSSAAWELYHMLLREQHWAFVHLAISAFGYFAAHTSCNQLWRFVPQDAALSFDLESGNEADEERFMSELKAFLEKEIVKPRSHQLELLVKEGQMLKELVQNSGKINPESIACDMMEIDDEKHFSRKRKFPDGINKGVELLQSGLKVMGDVLSQWQHNQVDSTEVHRTFLTHFSRVEDAIADLLSLAGSG
ncbi:uncharacterized protein LOC111389483 isoform X2 [Olea europaea var. sylvestris]|uniref:uncharacterized protein LOC111389483 isoform X2 n=1 Tax=Olea europaea var. sylvestris TaxID=158386 RepID=UPI000C1CFF11|nr:uncharacterized protein LOC111389483 isoform X2 [Olea europaea var. sylvestris]